MIIEIVRVPAEGKPYDIDEPASILELEHDDCLRVPHPVICRLHAIVVTSQLIVTGSVSVEMEFRCCRCAELFPLLVQDRSFSFYEPVPEGNESVDLTPSIREAIILAFPGYPVCSNDCKGLCSQCGQNRNRSKCDCVAPMDHRWSALDALEVNDP
jgi:uncharacterized protein